MFPEDGRLWLYGVGEDGVTAFTEEDQNLRQIILECPASAPMRQIGSGGRQKALGWRHRAGGDLR